MSMSHEYKCYYYPSVSGLPAPGRDRHPEAGGEDEVREPGGGAGGLLSCSDPRQ